MKKIIISAAALLLLNVQASALTVSFVQPDGVVSPTDSIDVVIRVTADADFNFDGNNPGDNFGIDPSLIPTSGVNFGTGDNLDFVSITGASTNISFTCSGSFSDGGDSVCPPGSDYDFSFNTGPDSFAFQDLFSLSAGESQDFLFGTFTPLDGSATPGEYNFFGANINFDVFGIGLDDFGNEVDIIGFGRFASTCATGDTSCDFSRTVVPVPGAVWLFGSAIAGLLGVRRRRNG